MKIAVSIPSRDAHGGVALAQWTIALALRLKGHDVRCLVPTARWMSLLQRFLPKKFRDFFIDMRAPTQAKILGPQFIITADWHSLWHRREVGIPVFHGGYGMTIKYAPPQSVLGWAKTSLLWWLQRKAAARAPIFIAVSQEAVDMFNLPNGYACLNAVDVERLSPATAEQKARAKTCLGLNGEILMIAGRWSPEKRLESIFELPPQTGRKIIVSIPDASEAKEFSSLCKKRKDILVRSFDRGIPEDVWSAVDCVYLPSRYEGCSMLWIEAAARGIPVVGTEVGHLIELGQKHPELKPLLMPRDDLSSAQEKINLAFSEYTKWKIIMRNLAEQHHNIKDLGTKFENLLIDIKKHSLHRSKKI